jgi:hypothetical protein
MNKRHLHHTWRKFRFIRPWYFLVLAIVSSVVCVYALRSNNEHMIVLRNAVYTADKNNTNVEEALRALQSYVTTHMNTNLSVGPNAVYPPIQLKYTYDRLVQAASNQATQANRQIYTDAQAYCEGLNHVDFSGHNRVPCIEQYVQSHTTKSVAIPDDLYKFSFASPLWSTDLAGWSMLAAIVSAIVFVITFLSDRWFRRNVA